MSSRYALAPEFTRIPSLTMPSNRLLLRLINGLVKLQLRGFRWSDDVKVREHAVEAEDGAIHTVTEIAPKDLDEVAPALLDYHGGGFFLLHSSSHLEYAQRYAIDARCRVFFSDYRLSIDHPFPAALNDCYAALAWVHANAGELRVDPNRIGLIGDSAGGALAAGVAQKAHDRNELPICGQILVYPVTDHETRSESALAFDDTPLWRTGSNRNMWKVYLRDTEYAKTGGRVAVPPYAAPLHREGFSGLPTAYVEVAEFDPLRDEGLQYAEALEKAGVPVEVHRIRGGIHGYDTIPGSETAAAAYKDRLAAIRRILT